MKQLLIYVSTDPYSHDLKLYKQMNEPAGHSLESMQAHIDAVKLDFNRKNLSALHLLMLDIKVEAGTVELVLNEFGKNPLKTRLEINPKAVEMMKSPSVTSAKFPGPEIIFNPQPGGAGVLHDDPQF